VSRGRDWWPLSDSDPVPGDPETLAGLGKQLANAAAEIERMATTLPKICSSGTWDSDAGGQFRVRAASTAASIGRTHRRFFTVARALGNSTYGGGGYAARLQGHQDQADAALTAVNGTASIAGTAGSEAGRRRAWTQLLDATQGADPTRPVPRPAQAGATGSSGVPALAGVPLPAFPRTPAGPMPLASPGVIPPSLPAFPDDPADVTALKNTYNTAIGTLRASARSITSAASGQAADAHAAAAAILTAIDNDGLNNPSGFLHWLDSTAGTVRGFAASHWAQFVSDLANVAGAIATVCGIIALVLAFIPGLQTFAAAFETVALLAQAVAFGCHLLLLTTGHGSLFDLAVDAVGLITFGVGKGLIGGAEATAKITESASSAYQTVAGDGQSVADLIEAGGAAAKTAGDAADVRLVAKTLEQMKEVVSIRPVFRTAMQAWQDGKFGDALGEHAVGTLTSGFKSAMGMGSPEIGSALSKAVEAGDGMPYAEGVTWALTSRIEGYQELFRVTQGTGVATDMASKLDSALNHYGLPLPGYDNLKSALPHGADG
jgi:hypothetical protein